eukprot:GHVN01037037.1.p1 GENE.GHVN01037037.1~~GHVN01037037.1.p1  ORF type:complete len:103 (-),score=37.36 GHVN01037037.1:55-363(-)
MRWREKTERHTHTLDPTPHRPSQHHTSVTHSAPISLNHLIPTPQESELTRLTQQNDILKSQIKSLRSRCEERESYVSELESQLTTRATMAKSTQEEATSVSE